ncbi:MAG: hypothetical protein EP305_00550 [Bacteroidetes bacterium]|nr:MAG: hypothetical protein EP305_00550 [Bacteroidota bacterium]
MEISLSYHNLESYDRTFNLSAHFLTELYSRILSQNGFNPKGIKKIAIALIKNRDENLMIKNEGVLLIKSNFHLLESTYEDAFQKAEEKLKIILNAIFYASDKYDLNKEIIINSYEQCLKLGLKNEYYFGNSILSKDKSHFGSLWLEHTEKSFDVYLDIFRSETKERIKRVKIASTLPYWVEYRDYLVPIKVNQNGFYLIVKNTKRKIEIPIPAHNSA